MIMDESTEHIEPDTWRDGAKGNVSRIDPACIQAFNSLNTKISVLDQCCYHSQQSWPNAH